jgi:hypothetical protein
MAIAYFLGNPKAQFFNPLTNTFLAGGLLYTYSPGSTTQIASYPTIADALATTNANTNPVVLDSTGSAVVVLNQNTKLVLKDSSGNQIWAVDNYAGTSSSSSGNTVYDSNGNTVLSFLSPSNAVNYAQITAAATGNSVVLGAAGSDTNVNLTLTPKGTGSLIVNASNISMSGSVNGSAAAAGKIGEQVEFIRLATDGITVSHNTSTDIGVLSLSAGVWDIDGNISIANSGSQIVNAYGWSNTISGTPVDRAYYSQFATGAPTLFIAVGCILVPRTYTFTTTTNVFFSCFHFTNNASASTGFGYMRARRVR